MTAKIYTPPTKSEGRKIDTWKFEMPDGNKYDITINMISNRDGIKFLAFANSGLFSKFSMESGDINELKNIVTDRAREIADHYLGADWIDAVHIHTQSCELSKKKKNSWGLRVDWSLLKMNSSIPPDNMGHVQTLNSGSPQQTQTRSHRLKIPTDDSDSLLKKVNARRNEGESIAVVPATVETLQALQQQRQLMRIFEDKLMDRMSPHNLSILGVPGPDEICSILQNSRAHLADGKIIPEMTDGEFQI